MPLTMFLLPAILLILSFATGFWVHKSGRPYQPFAFNIHKLLSLAVVIFTTIKLVGAIIIAPVSSLSILLLILAGVSVVILFATGALMSAPKTFSKLWQIVHHLSPYLLASSLTLTILLLAGILRG